MPVAYPYYRVSTEDQAVAQQRGVVEGYFAFALRPKGFTLGEGFADEGVSGDIPFLDRPSGHRCAMACEGGDAVIALKLDRAFRNTRDCLNTVDVLGARGVTFHLLDLPAQDLGTAVGRLCLTMVAAFAEFERNRMSERMREFFRNRRAQGLPVGDHRPPYGHRWGVMWGKGKGKRVAVRDEKSREVGRAIVLWRDVEGMTWEGVWGRIRLAAFGQKVAMPVKSLKGVRRLYAAEKALSAAEALRKGAVT